MSGNKIVLDTGPLVAFLNKNDKYHSWAVSEFAVIKPPLFTCESVLSEACFLLRDFPDGVANIITLLERELIRIYFHLADEIISVKNLMIKYANVPMSLSDACLVRMSEQISDSKVFTLDSDFRIYRKNKRQVIPLIIPEDL